MNALHVHPALHGRGIGRDLLDALLKGSAALRRFSVQLYVLSANSASRRFYQHLGWRLEGTSPAHSIAGRPVDTVRYEIHLPSTW